MEPTWITDCDVYSEQLKPLPVIFVLIIDLFSLVGVNHYGHKVENAFFLPWRNSKHITQLLSDFGEQKLRPDGLSEAVCWSPNMHAIKCCFLLSCCLSSQFESGEESKI